MKHEIWSNIDLDFDDWKETLLEDATNMGLPTDDESLYQMMVERNDEFLEDEIMNLRSACADAELVILCDIGTWQGRREGVLYTNSISIGAAIQSALSHGGDYADIYVDDDGDLTIDTWHHDGVNHITIRALSDPDGLDKAIDAVLDGDPDATASLFAATSPVGAVVGAVYGWED